jgi:hypothetical protein
MLILLLLLLLLLLLPIVGATPGTIFIAATADQTSGANNGGGLLVMGGFFAGILLGVFLRPRGGAPTTRTMRGTSGSRRKSGRPLTPTAVWSTAHRCGPDAAP